MTRLHNSPLNLMLLRWRLCFLMNEFDPRVPCGIFISRYETGYQLFLAQDAYFRSEMLYPSYIKCLCYWVLL